MNAQGELRGVLVAGLGEGARFTQLDWARQEFRTALGYEPFPGTVNLRMEGEAWRQCRRRLQQAAGVEIKAPPGFCRARCFPLRVNGTVPGAIVLPEVENYPEDKLELVAPVPVRQTLGLRDGDIVSLQLEPL